MRNAPHVVSGRVTPDQLAKVQALARVRLTNVASLTTEALVSLANGGKDPTGALEDLLRQMGIDKSLSPDEIIALLTPLITDITAGLAGEPAAPKPPKAPAGPPAPDPLAGVADPPVALSAIERAALSKIKDPAHRARFTELRKQRAAERLAGTKRKIK